jgi:acyl carrier protein
VKSEPEVRAHLARWVAERSQRVLAEDISGDTPILERRLITSVQVMDLILEIEQLSGKSIDVSRLKPGVFKDIDTIYRNFFAGQTV